MATRVHRLAAWIGLAVGLLGTPASLASQSQRARMVDEAWRDPELVLVRHDIVLAALKRDTAALRPNLDENFLSSFGGGGGIDELFQTLSAQPGLWDELIEVLSLGGRFGRDSSEYSAPFWAAGLDCTPPPAPTTGAATSDTSPDVAAPRFDCDGFEVLLVLGTNVRVRATPGGAPVEALSLSLVSKDRQKSDVATSDGGTWTPVILPNGIHGWIASRLLRSPVGRRAGFRRDPRGRWRMTSFVAGD